MEGKINDGHLPGMRAVMAANIINERYGWMQAEEIGIRHKQEVSDCCMEILRKMDKFSWERYEAELVKHGYGVHIQKMRTARFMAIPSSEVTPVISPQSWVLVVTLSPQRL